jgi:uncharacterized protein DUF5658
MMRLEHTGKQLSFVLLSLADLALTWALIRDGLGSVYESNPVAAWCLQGYGWAGMAAFKALMVLASGGLSEVISRYRPRSGGRVLVLGCFLTASVVLYSGYLYLTVAATGTSASMSIAQEQIEMVRKERFRIPFTDGPSGEGRTTSTETLRAPVRKPKRLLWAWPSVILPFLGGIWAQREPSRILQISNNVGPATQEP